MTAFMERTTCGIEAQFILREQTSALLLDYVVF